MIRFITTYLFITLASTCVTMAKGWRGITPLQSSCADVQRILGVDKCENKRYRINDKSIASVRLTFSQYPCHEKWPYESYAIAPGIVVHISVTFHPDHYKSLSELKIDEKEFTKIQLSDLPDYYYYSDDDGGFAFYLTPAGLVSSMSFYPSVKDRGLLCPHLTGTEQGKDGEAAEVGPPASKFDEYGKTALGEETSRLDRIAREVKDRGDNKKVYLVAYAGRYTFSGEARTWLEGAKEYLVKTHRIPEGLVVTMDGGYREKATMEIYVKRPQESKPRIEPTVHPSQVIYK